MRAIPSRSPASRLWIARRGSPSPGGPTSLAHPSGEAPRGERSAYPPRRLAVSSSAIRNKHSGPRPPDAADPRVPLVPPPNPSVIPKHPPRGQDAAHFSEHAADAPNGTLAFLFTFGDLTLLWHDSALQPGGARSLRDQGRLAVPRRCGRPDRGHWLGEFNQFTNGLKDAGDYIEAATPKVFIPTHHDNFLPPLTTEGRAYFAPLVAELGRIPPSVRPELCFITDPESYSTVFDFTISRWAGGSHGTLSGCVMAG